MDETQLRLLKLAYKKIEELKQNQNLFTSLSYSTQFEEGKSEYGFKNRPDPVVVKAAALDIRHFLAQGSDIHMGKLVSTLRPSLEGEQLAKLDKFYTVWKELTEGRQRGTGMGIELKMNGKPLYPKELLDLWVNGDFFHLDSEKTKAFEEMGSNPFQGLHELIFIGTIQNIAQLLFYFQVNFLASL